MFAIHPQLLADCHTLGRLPATHLLLHKNAAVPWCILVPETDSANLLDLPVAQRDAVLADGKRASDYLVGPLGCARVNVAWIGNLVPQLHIHVIGRNPADAYWPKPVWVGPGVSSRIIAYDNAGTDPAAPLNEFSRGDEGDQAPRGALRWAPLRDGREPPRAPDRPVVMGGRAPGADAAGAVAVTSLPVAARPEAVTASRRVRRPYPMVAVAMRRRGGAISAARRASGSKVHSMP